MKEKRISCPILDYKETSEEIYSFIKKIVEEAGVDGVVIGLSGGVDSSLAVTLCVNALGSDRVLGVLLPTDFTPKQDMDDAQELADLLGIRTEFRNITTICKNFFKDLDIEEIDSKKLYIANIYARVRMVILYYYANRNNYLVVGTGDRSEALIGFFTKYGDGGADLFPIIHLYKTQVRALTQYLGIMENISKKPASPQLYPGHKATDEIPLDYDKLDPVLVGLFDLKLSISEVSRLTGIPTETVERVLARFNASKHKRAFPPTVKGL